MALKRKEMPTGYNTDELKGIIPRDKPVTEGQRLYDSMHMRSLESQIHRDRKQKADCRGLGRREKGELVSDGDRFGLGRRKSSGGDGCPTVWF